METEIDFIYKKALTLILQDSSNFSNLKSNKLNFVEEDLI